MDQEIMPLFASVAPDALVITTELRVVDTIGNVPLLAAVAAPDFRDSQVKEGKQAEFLLHEFFPWHLVRRIGVFDATVYGKVVNAAQNATHRPAVEVRREW